MKSKSVAQQTTKLEDQIDYLWKDYSLDGKFENYLFASMQQSLLLKLCWSIVFQLQEYLILFRVILEVSNLISSRKFLENKNFQFLLLNTNKKVYYLAISDWVNCVKNIQELDNFE